MVRTRQLFSSLAVNALVQAFLLYFRKKRLIDSYRCWFPLGLFLGAVWFLIASLREGKESKTFVALCESVFSLVVFCASRSKAREAIKI